MRRYMPILSRRLPQDSGCCRSTGRGPMLKHQLAVATVAFAALTLSESGGRAATMPPLTVPNPTTATAVRFGGHGFGGGGIGHFGGRGFGHFGGFGFRHFGFAPHHAFVGHFHRPVFVHRFHRPFFVHRFHRRVFVRRAFFIGAPVYYAYGGGCAWLRYRALVTGSPYWWRRYRWCLGW